jgi:sulfotransferase
MTTKFHFISGLPRSGSTLLAAILRQNPRFHSGMTSPLGALFSSMLANFSAGSEFGPVVTTTQRRNLLRGLFSSYYQEMADKEVILDTNRMWCAKLPALLDLFPDAKIIACVRNVAWIMDSIERKFRENPFENTRLFNDDIERNTVYSRVDTLAQRNRLVGFAWSALKEAFYGEQAGSLLLVDYDLLSNAPGRVLPLVYQFLGEAPYPHDFDHVAYDAPDFDAALGMSGLHRVRQKVSYVPRPTLLPPDLFRNYSDMSFWLNQDGSRASVITAKPAQT